MDGKDFISDRVRLNTSDLFKRMLLILEDIKHEHDRQFALLFDSAPDAFKPVVRQANYLDDENRAWLRKRVLDFGNETIRKLLTEFETVRVEFKFKQ